MLIEKIMNSNSIGSTSQLQAEVRQLPAHLASKAVPIKIRQSFQRIKDIETNVIVQEFADQILVIVSQLGKVGCLTQVTIQNRPNYSISQAAFDLDDDDAVEKHFARQQQQQQQQQIPLNDDSLNSEQAAMLGNCHQQRLLGTHPPGQKALYDLYNIHIALQTHQILSSKANSVDTGSLSEKPVVVGLALQQKHALDTNGQGEDDEDEDFDVLANDERDRFEAILALVKEACNS